MVPARISRTACFALVAANLVSLAVVHLFWPGLRFEYGALNYAVFIVLHLLLPPLLLLLAFSLHGKYSRITAFVLAATVALPTGLLSFSAAGELIEVLSFDTDPSLQPIAEMSHGEFTYRLYRTNYNPLKAHGMLLRKEQTLIAGVKLVSDVKGFYGTRDGDLQALEDGLARVTTKPAHSQAKVEVFEFKP